MAAYSKTKPSKHFGSQDKLNLFNLLVVGLVSTVLMIKNADAQDAGLLERLEALEGEFSDLKRTIAASLLASPEPCADLPGEWVEAKEFSGRFLLGAGEEHFGSEGGEATVTLTAKELPKHRHGVRNGADHRIGAARDANAATVGVTRLENIGSVNSGFSGAGGAHNNMPPYRVVHFCKLEAK